MSYDDQSVIDPNAIGIASLLGGLFVLGVGANLLVEIEDRQFGIQLSYFGLFLLAASVVSFGYSFCRWMTPGMCGSYCGDSSKERTRLIPKKDNKLCSKPTSKDGILHV